ncbi:maestro heat-like repeat-containing protein family member 7 [Calypte anna]|uniref:maestro heat-like repeat-containing protein family member 7 n=1 Tax=Calypte anna TaxID=9244 RepID=UPI0011C42222|nr:maestro heat-like repeat-containing protein family member 7 [Calypte anna]
MGLPHAAGAPEHTEEPCSIPGSTLLPCCLHPLPCTAAGNLGQGPDLSARGRVTVLCWPRGATLNQEGSPQSNSSVCALRAIPVPFLQASRVLRRFSQSSRCQGSLEVLFPRLLIALLNHLAWAAQTLLDKEPEDDQPSPSRCAIPLPCHSPGPSAGAPALCVTGSCSAHREAVEAIKDLLCVAGCGENVQQMQEEGGWDMMLQGETLEAGVSLLAREMCRSPARVRFSLFLHTRDIVYCGRKQENTFAMAFYVELLGCQDMAKQSSDLQILRSYLDCGSDSMLLLVLRGLVAVAQDPDVAAEMQDRAMLDFVLGRLEHNSEEVRVEALLLLRKITAHPTGDEEAIHITLMLAEKLPLLFGDESSQVRELSIELFGETMGTLVSGKERWMQIIIHGNLVSLLLRMNDKTESVAQASAKALLICAKILGWRKLKREVKRKRTTRIAEILVERDRDVKYHVHACLPYLRDAQCDVRLAAIKFMGAAARHLSEDSRHGRAAGNDAM